MTKGIFTTKIDPTYDDIPEIRYHFPKMYLNQVNATVGDWIIYYEPRRQSADLAGHKGRKSYFATARVVKIKPDKNLVDHYYAFVTDYLEFYKPVPFKHDDIYFESKLRKEDGSTNKGAFGRSVRLLPDSEYEDILQAGFSGLVRKSRNEITVVHDPQAEYNRPIIEQIIHRPFRDAAFARKVGDAYDYTCAITGQRILDSEGHCEIEAAHIRPVGNKHFGPDSIRNGIALSRTVHWMFDHGILSLSDNHKVLMKKEYVPDKLKRFVAPGERILLPSDVKLRPHPQFLNYHRKLHGL